MKRYNFVCPNCDNPNIRKSETPKELKDKVTQCDYCMEYILMSDLKEETDIREERGGELPTPESDENDTPDIAQGDIDQNPKDLEERVEKVEEELETYGSGENTERVGRRNQGETVERKQEETVERRVEEEPRRTVDEQREEPERKEIESRQETNRTVGERRTEEVQEEDESDEVFDDIDERPSFTEDIRSTVTNVLGKATNKKPIVDTDKYMAEEPDPLVEPQDVLSKKPGVMTQRVKTEQKTKQTSDFDNRQETKEVGVVKGKRKSVEPRDVQAQRKIKRTGAFSKEVKETEDVESNIPLLEAESMKSVIPRKETDEKKVFVSEVDAENIISTRQTKDTSEIEGERKEINTDVYVADRAYELNMHDLKECIDIEEEKLNEFYQDIASKMNNIYEYYSYNKIIEDKSPMGPSVSTDKYEANLEDEVREELVIFSDSDSLYDSSDVLSDSEKDSLKDGMQEFLEKSGNKGIKSPLVADWEYVA